MASPDRNDRFAFPLPSQTLEVHHPWMWRDSEQRRTFLEHVDASLPQLRYLAKTQLCPRCHALVCRKRTEAHRLPRWPLGPYLPDASFTSVVGSFDRSIYFVPFLLVETRPWTLGCLQPTTSDAYGNDLLLQRAIAQYFEFLDAVAGETNAAADRRNLALVFAITRQMIFGLGTVNRTKSSSTKVVCVDGGQVAARWRPHCSTLL